MDRLHQQLQQLDSLLKDTPNDTALISLRDELLEVIALSAGGEAGGTKKNSKLTTAAANAPKENSQSSRLNGENGETEEDERSMMHVPEVSSWTAVVKSSGIGTSGSTSSSSTTTTGNTNATIGGGTMTTTTTTTTTSKNDTNVHDANNASSSRGNGGITGSIPEGEDEVDLLPNQRCEIKPNGEKRWQGAVVEERLPNFEYRVQRLFDGERFHVKSRSKEIRPVTVPEEVLRLSSLIQNMRLHARYSGDGKYYPAIVQKVTDHGCILLYEGFEDDPPEHVALEHLRVPPPGSTAALRSTSADFEVPPELVVLPTDGEEERQSKLRQQKVLKRKRVREEMEQRQENKQHSWQAFQATAKRPKGSYTSVNGAMPSTLFERKKLPAAAAAGSDEE